MADTSFNNKLFNYYKNAIDMLICRGYSKKHLTQFYTKTEDEFAKSSAKNWIMINTHDEKDRIVWLYISDSGDAFKKDELDNVAYFVHDIIESKKKEFVNKKVSIIIVVETRDKSINTNSILVSKECGIPIELMEYWELGFDPTLSRLTPKHELILQEDAKELFDSGRVKKEDLKNFLSTERITRWFGAKPGDIFKITRSTETGGREITYGRVSKTNQ